MTREHDPKRPAANAPGEGRTFDCLIPTPVTVAIRALLDGAGVQYRYVEHGPTRTSEESAQARGESLDIGGKSLLLKVGGTFRLCVVPASRKIRSNAVRRHYGASKARFATRDELALLTGLVPGCVPPLGPPVLDLPLCVDRSLLEGPRVAFNPGCLTSSIIMATDDYALLAQPEAFDFSGPAEPGD